MKLYYVTADELQGGQWRVVEFLVKAPTLEAAQVKANKCIRKEWDCDEEDITVQADGSINFFDTITIKNVAVAETTPSEFVKQFIRS